VQGPEITQLGAFIIFYPGFFRRDGAQAGAIYTQKKKFMYALDKQVLK
jgi:hypothetical protein